jgi:predicted  nucleic acid-binding Zn-ribbon protein
MSELQTIIQFNEELLDGATGGVLETLQATADAAERDGSVTDKLLDDSESVVCWTCGSEVETGQIEATVDHLRELRQLKLDERTDLRSRVDELKEARADLERTRESRERLDRRLRENEAEIERREESIDELSAREESVREEIAELRESVEALETEEHSEFVDLHRKVNESKFELGKLESELDRVNDEIDEIEARIAEREELIDRREQLRAEVAERRTRIERIETQAIDEFNDHMERVLEILDYENLARIWIERSEREVREGRRKVTKTFFDLHIVRETESGTVYEDTIAHLSESEREVTGLVFALAGYLAHDVYEEVPFIVLDSLEAIDSDRIARLIEYIEEYAEYIVVALLPEDASAIPREHGRVSEI